MKSAKTLLPLLLLLLPASALWAAEAPTEPTDAVTEAVAEAVANPMIHSPAVGTTATEVAMPIAEVATGLAADDPSLFTAPFETGWGGGSSCTGTLGLFVSPTCLTCNVNRSACEDACFHRGGVKRFRCGGGGIYCECNDGAYDSCGC